MTLVCSLLLDVSIFEARLTMKDATMMIDALRLFSCCTALLVFAAACQNEPKSDNNTEDKVTKAADRPENMIIDQLPPDQVLGSKIHRLVYYQPETELEQNLETPMTFRDFVSQTSQAIHRQIGKIPKESPSSGAVVIAINEKQQTRVWYMFPDEPSASLKSAVAKAVEGMELPKVKNDLVVFGIALSLWGYTETEEDAKVVPMPKEWTEAGKKFKEPQTAAKLARLTW